MTQALSLAQIASSLANPNARKGFIYPEGQPRTRAQVALDWMSAGIISTVTNGDFEQALDHDDSIDSQSGRPSPDVYPKGSLVVLVGGPSSHNVINYYMNRAVGKEKAPIHATWVGTGSHAKLLFVERSGERIAELDREQLAISEQDYGTIQTFKDTNGRLILLVCGMNWQGTWAASLWFRYHGERENSCSAILVQWKDSNHNGLVELAEVKRIRQFEF